MRFCLIEGSLNIRLGHETHISNIITEKKCEIFTVNSFFYPPRTQF